jgi:peptide/nickel transport system substrate-binding protein
MRRVSLARLIVLLLAACALVAAGCGGDDNGGSGSGSSNKSTGGADTGGKQGGAVTFLAAADVDYLDPGQTYYTFGYMVHYAVNRTLYSFTPDDSAKPVPDIAEAEPEISQDSKEITVKIKPGIKFAPPVNREVTSKDVKYAIERGFFTSVASGPVSTYFADLEGAKIGSSPGSHISGITTPDDQTVVFKFKRAVGGTMAAGALAYPSTAPVPEAYAKQYDDQAQSTYGEHQLATGPYMIENDQSGKTIGYEPGKRIHLVRNPNWDKSLDFKPAYLDEIDNLEGNDDPGVASRRILTGKSMINGDFSPLPENLKDAVANYKDQLVLTPGGGGRWVAFNTTMKPFDNINVRKAIFAGMDRNALRLTRGGALIGDIATHYIPPGMKGFEEAGGMKGTGVDFLSPDGKPNPQLSAEYFKKAGYASGKYEGKEKILMVGDNVGVAAKTAEVVKQQLTDMGFNIELRLVQHQTMYTRYCNRPASKVAICPNVGWNKDFSDGQTMLSPTFNGKNIIPEGNSNWPQLDDPQINKAIDDAELLPKDQRPAAWAAIDKMVVAQAAALPWLWDKTPLIRSANVNGVVAEDNAQWSLPFTSVQQ